MHDETYTFNQDSFSRTNVHVLTSIDYDKMSAEDKAKETDPRTDHDYALSWIRREGKGRLFYMAHGHDERIYADDADARAPARRHPVRARRSEGRRQSEREAGHEDDGGKVASGFSRKDQIDARSAGL